MPSQAPDAELATPVASANPPVSSSSPAAYLESLLPLEEQVDASNGPPQLNDEVLRQAMEKSGTRNGRMLQETLASAPYNLKVSYEVVRRRVEKLLEEEENETDNNNNNEEEEEEADGKTHNEGRDQAAAARDLDMLADTVRSIVTYVVESEVSIADGEKDDETVGNGAGNHSLTETPDDVDTLDVNGAIEMENIAELAAKGDSPSVGNRTDTQVMEIMDTGAVIPEVTQDADDAAIIAVTIPSKNTTDTEAIALKRSVTETEASSHAPKRQKRAEYSVETRALCVRRHQIDGASYATISKDLGIPHDTVRAIVRKAKRTGTVNSAPRSGRPRKTSGIVDKVILEAVKSNKRCSAKSIQEELLRLYGVKLSPETVRRRVLEHTKQRMQFISGGTSSDVVDSRKEICATSNDVVETPATSSQKVMTATNESLLDPVSFQQLLHEEEQSTGATEQRVGRSVAVTGPGAEIAQSRRSRLPPPPPVDNGVAEPEDTPQSQSVSLQQDDEASAQKKPKRGEYSIETREECVRLHAQGQGYRRIGKALNMPHTTVRAIVEKAQRTGSVLPAKRSGRPRKTDAIVDKVILQAVKTNEKSSARMIKEQLLAAYGVRVSCETIRRRVKDHSRQCMSNAASTSEGLPDAADSALDHQQIPDQDLLASSPSMPVASLMTFDEQGVHL